MNDTETSNDGSVARLARHEDLWEHVKETERLYLPLTPETAELGGLAIVCWTSGKVRLTSRGRHWYREACSLAGIEPAMVRTLAQLTQVRRMDAELTLQRLMDAELAELENQPCI